MYISYLCNVRKKTMPYFNFNINNELFYKTSRSSGSGGQHVNKTESKVEIIFDIINSQLLNDNTKKELLEKLSSKLVNGCIHVFSQSSRSQIENKRIAIEKLYALLEKALTPLKKRKKTKVPKAVKEKIKDSKKKNSEKKKLRNKLRF